MKLALTATLLRHRRSEPELYAAGSYLPLEVRGPGKDHVIAFRPASAPAVVDHGGTTAAHDAHRWPAPGRLVLGRTSVRLPDTAPRQLVELVTGAVVDIAGNRVSLDRVLMTVPVAVLTGR